MQVEKLIDDEDKTEKLKLIGLIMEPYVQKESEEVCGDKFNKLYDKTVSELKIYYNVFK